ncbi:MAG: sugar ABC transporter permease [Clostridiaceae bacterium]|nr:sugar ABC transporter permease [Clostridiaceae bacterium]
MWRQSKASTYFQIYLMLFPSLLIFAVLSVYPIMWALRYVFFDYNGFNNPRFIGLDNFIRAFKRDPLFLNAVKNTFIYAGGKILIILPLAFILALILNRKSKIHGALQALIFSPTIISSAVMSLVFYLLLNVYNGEVNRLLLNIGLVDSPVNWLGSKYAMLSTIIVSVWAGLGNYMVYFLAGLQGIPDEIYESGAIDGANSFQRLFYITVPMLGPMLKVILMLALITAFQDMSNILVLTGGGPFGKTNVMSLYVYSLYFPVSASDTATFMPQYGYGAAVSVISACIVGVITVLYLRISKKLDDIY